MVITGKTPPTSVAEYYGNDIPFIKTPDMHGNVYITSSECSLSKAGADSQKNKYLPENTVVVACIGANAGEVALTSYIAQWFYTYLLRLILYIFYEQFSHCSA